MVPDISYFILSYNPDNHAVSNEILSRTLQTFYERKSPNLTCEVLLIHQGGRQSQKDFIYTKSNEYGFNTLFLDKNAGISRGVNYAVRLVKAPIIALITSDIMITKGMDEDLFQKVQIPEVFQATGLTNKSEVPLQQLQVNEPFGAETVKLTNKPSIKTIGVELNVMFWRREIFDLIGYFDESWKACFECNDFSLRCYLAGGHTLISQDSYVWHYGHQCVKSGARNKAYDDYIHMPKGFTQEPLLKIWQDKWLGIAHNSIYREVGNEDRSSLQKTYAHNIYLPYHQGVSY